MLCDAERVVIREWDLLNGRERGGIAKPSVFVIDPGLSVRYAAVDTVARRVQAAHIISVLQTGREEVQIRPKTYWPRAGDWVRAMRNNSRKEREAKPEHRP